MKKVVNGLLAVLVICLAAGIGLFIYDSVNSYKVNKGFQSLPLQFNPQDSSSFYKNENGSITVYGGFVKGIQKDKSGNEAIVIRALSPTPSIKADWYAQGTVSLLLENINPDRKSTRLNSSH